MPSLQEQHRAATRDRILHAVHAVLAEESPATLSIPRVAERAGTSLRTVYRYFPTKEALVDAASLASESATHGAAGRFPGIAGLADYLRSVWGEFAKIVGSVRAQHATPAGRELRMARLPRARAAARAAIEGDGIELPDDDMARLVDLGVLLISSSAFLELTDRLGRSVDDAADLAAWATEACLDKARREGRVAR